MFMNGNDGRKNIGFFVVNKDNDLFYEKIICKIFIFKWCFVFIVSFDVNCNLN